MTRFLPCFICFLYCQILPDGGYAYCVVIIEYMAIFKSQYGGKILPVPYGIFSGRTEQDALGFEV